MIPQYGAAAAAWLAVEVAADAAATGVIPATEMAAATTMIFVLRNISSSSSERVPRIYRDNAKQTCGTPERCFRIRFVSGTPDVTFAGAGMWWTVTGVVRSVRETDVVVVGAGQAGLSSAYFLRRAGLEYVVLDANSAPGGAWRHRWPTLRMATVHGIFDLPGMRFDPPEEAEPAARAVPAYFAAYEREFALDVRRPVPVRAVRPGPGDRLLVETGADDWAARAVINATGTWTRPFWPRYPGQETFRGRQLHTADYRGPNEFAGRRVVVVGGGSSAVQLLLEIAEVAETTWVTRRPPEFHEGPFTEDYGRQVIAAVDARVRAGLPPHSVVHATGLALTPEVLAARRRGLLDRHPMFDRITPEGVAWADGTFVAADVILWCTGWRAALDHLAPLKLRGPGGGIVMDGTRVVAQPRLHLVGYGPSASTVGANRAGRAAVREIRELLAPVAACGITGSSRTG